MIKFGVRKRRANRWSCRISPEALQVVESQFAPKIEFVAVKASLEESGVNYLRLVKDEEAVKNSVDVLECDQDFVFLRPELDLNVLKTVTLSLRSEDALEKVKCDILKNKIAVEEGQRIENVEVKSCEPFFIGIVDPKETDIRILVETVSSSNLAESAFCAASIIGKEKIKRKLEFPFTAQECPTKFMREICLLNGESPNSTITFNDPDWSYGSSWVIVTEAGTSIKLLLRAVNSKKVLKRPLKFFSATPALLSRFSKGESYQILRVDDEEYVEVKIASEAQIAFIDTDRFRSTADSQVSDLVKAFFKVKRYVLPASFIELEDGLIFKVVIIKDSTGEGVGSWISEFTTVHQKTTLKTFLPPITLKSCDERLLPICPPFLRQFEEKCERLLKSTTKTLLCGIRASGKSELYKSLSMQMGVSVFQVDAGLLVCDSSGSTEAKVRSAFATARDRQPCLFVLGSIQRLALNREGKTDFRVIEHLRHELADNKDGLYVIGDCDVPKDDVDKNLAAVFEHCLEIPKIENREATFDWILKSEGKQCSMASQAVAMRTAGFVFGDLKSLVRKAAFHTGSKKYMKLSVEAVEKALTELQDELADSIGAPKIPTVKWADVGGLEGAKREVLDTLQMPLKHPELLEGSLKRSGVLMYGPPGVGKTLLAKAVATECALNFLSVKGPELLNMYVGQSEENVRRVFERARSAAPCVIFFDELDSLAPNRGRSGDSGGVMDRVVSQLLAELDEASPGVFVIGATNRPDLLDQALLRPGRFDRLVYLGIADDVEEQRRILASLTRKFSLAEDCSVEDISALLPKGLTGADLYSICSEASLVAIAKKIRAIESNEERDRKIVVAKSDFVEALRKFTPSVTVEDLTYYESVHEAINEERS